MPGPGNQKKRNNKTKNKANDEPAVRQPQPQVVQQTPMFQCQTLEEDEVTRCDQPATEGYPKKERCTKHQKQYILMYKKYKDAVQIVDGLRKNDIPGEEQINQYKDVSSSLKKARMIRKYVEAIRVERTGRQIHQTRFFLKVDDGHKIRVKLLAKEIDKGIKALNALHIRAYDLYAAENSLPDWAKQPGSDSAGAPIAGDPTLGAESFKESSTFVPGGLSEGVRQSQAQNIEGDEDEDVIDLKLQREKAKIFCSFKPFLDRDSMISQLESQGLTDPGKRRGLELDKMKYQGKMLYIIMQQYIRRIIFHDPVLFMKALDKVSFEDLLLSEDFSIEDMLRIWQLLNKRLHIGLRWYKDAVVEAIAIRDAGTAANVGAPADRFQIVGGWIFNRTHLCKTSNEAWYWLLTTLEPPANIENRFVRLCNTYDDVIDFLSHGAIGLYPSPSFCQSKHGDAVIYRNHLSLAGVVICDMFSAAKPPQLYGPFPTTRRPRQPGCIVWAEMESRSYMFGALRNEPDAFQEAFLNELKARPDLFQVVTRCDSDPPRLVKVFGNGDAGALPRLRSRTFEAPAASPQNPPQGFGEWTTDRSAVDILYGIDEYMGGYLVSPMAWANKSNDNLNFFFHFKTFPVTYIVILDTTPDRHYDVLAKQVAWAAFRAKGIVKGAYEPRKYAIASNKFFEDCAKERLSWMPECMGTWQATMLAGLREVAQFD